ncbi:substrate-binding domain-containing protein [Anaerocolumna sedimenticola]|uniref:Substrate-binding domain-containing protein n=1 Tax=Anaerocolumna sedimenticola TaxID=2696063 RepID=A0A6P1TLM6_9FIRM|nr:LacI family DNA-binding transcriptional regulator [Anaerocolumna sedimenticola]QHQ61032.1 substrate-binding domain-containing protein [Anaerocolumna sedimenticola]
MTTIYDIADKTGLSASTVARALNGSGYCSDKAKKKVFAAAEELGYVPYQAAKTLKSSITNKIMFCIPDIMNPYYFDMIKGVTQTLEDYNYNILLAYTMHSPEKELEILNSLKGRYVDGLIFGSFDYNPTLIEAIKDTGLPTAITSFYENSEYHNYYDCIYANQSRAAWIATHHCIENGHTRIAFLGGDPKEQNTKERFEGYCRALEESGIPVDNTLIINANFTRELALQKFQQFIRNDGKCTAVVACNDLMGIGCMNACSMLGLKVPDDISIVSLDNTEYCLCTNPPMTSVDMMQGKVGTEAARLVMDRILNKRSYRTDIVFSPEIIKRESVKKITL